MFCEVSAQALRGEFDEHGRPLNAEISGGALFCGAAPGEPRICGVLFHLGHFRGGDRLVHNSGPFARQIEEHFALLRREVSAFDSFRLNRLPVVARAKHQVANLKAENGLFALRIVERL